MKDLLVQSRFRNNILWTLMGGRTTAEVCREIGVDQSLFGALLNLKTSPLLKRANGYRAEAVRIANHFKMLPEDLFPDALYKLNLPKLVNREYESEHVSLLLAKGQPSLLPSPEEVIEANELKKAVKVALGSLTPREQDIARRLYGIDRDQETYEEVGEALQMTKARVQQLHERVLRRLRHPSRGRQLKAFVLPRDEMTLWEDDEEEQKREVEAARIEAAYRMRHHGWASGVILEGEKKNA